VYAGWTAKDTLVAIRTLKRGVRDVLTGLADLFLPDVCSGCGSADVSTGGLCEACNVKLLSLVSLPYCPHCGSTLGPNVPVYEDGCGGCPTVLPRFERVFRLGPYADPLRAAIRDMKYRRFFGLRRRFGFMLAEAIRAAEQRGAASFDVIIPVPMHWQRRIARGQDHAALLAATIARDLRVPLGRELLRVRNTPPQINLSRTARAANVRGAFAVADKRSIAAARVLLVDDVTTTGATANEAARTLLAAGAATVSLAVIAKAEPPTAYAGHWM